MTIVAVTRTTWVQLNTVAAIIQPAGGHILVADNAAPAAGDFIAIRPGTLLTVTAPRWGQAAGTISTTVVVQAP